MKIDKVYVSCCRNDFYLTRICIASIRYWNADIPIVLLKDFSRGNFTTKEMERVFNVGIAPLDIKNTGAYSKLYPFMEETKGRVLVLDSDTVWLGNIIADLEKFDEDLIVDGYSPENTGAEIAKWYFRENLLKEHYGEFPYPGFLFNSGQMVVSNDKFSKDDFLPYVKWKENIEPVVENIFLCEDQGILNYVIARKIASQLISVRSHKLFLWGWDKEIQKITVSDLRSKKSLPFLIHWYGEKKGLVSILPNHPLLKFYEAWYYSKLALGSTRLQADRFSRTIKHFDNFVYEIVKRAYLKLRVLNHKK